MVALRRLESSETVTDDSFESPGAAIVRASDASLSHGNDVHGWATWVKSSVTGDWTWINPDQTWVTVAADDHRTPSTLKSDLVSWLSGSYAQQTNRRCLPGFPRTTHDYLSCGHVLDMPSGAPSASGLYGLVNSVPGVPAIRDYSCDFIEYIDPCQEFRNALSDYPAIRAQTSSVLDLIAQLAAALTVAYGEVEQAGRVLTSTDPEPADQVAFGDFPDRKVVRFKSVKVVELKPLISTDDLLD